MHCSHLQRKWATPRSYIDIIVISLQSPHVGVSKQTNAIPNNTGHIKHLYKRSHTSVMQVVCLNVDNGIDFKTIIGYSLAIYSITYSSGFYCPAFRKPSQHLKVRCILNSNS